MPGETPREIAIIGAGLSGLCLALALHAESIPCTLYESRPSPLDIGGAIMLSPNALRILDTLGIYDRLKPLGYNFDRLHFRTGDDDKLLDTFDFGGVEKHGYQGMRVYRFELINTLVEALKERGVHPLYGKKFIKVVEESDEGVKWEFDDGSTGQASVLVGADGIHSRVRTHINPSVQPAFMKVIAVTAAIPTSQLGLDDISEKGHYPLPVTIMNKTHGAFVIAPQKRDGSECLIGRQRFFTEEPGREVWNDILSNKEWCLDFLRKDIQDFPDVAQRAVSSIPVENVNLWPFYAIPKLPSWTSGKGRVVILGDAAHAIPPTSGQGVNQAFEDVFVFARVVARFGTGRVPSSAMATWQVKRQERVDKVLELNAQINKRRMPVEGQKVDAGPEKFELGWLYDVDFDQMVEEIVGQVE